MTLTTERLHIREISLADINNIHELHSLPQTDEFNTLGIPGTIEITEKIVNEWLEAKNFNPQVSYVFCLMHINTEQFIGVMALISGKPKFRSAEVWYKIHADYWRQGYASEALVKILDFGFNQLKLHRIEAGCAVENIASGSVLEKAGMMKEGMKRKVLPIRGDWKDAYSYAMLEEDFIKLKE